MLTRTPEYLAKNPNGKVPLLGLPDGSFLPESNAILHYLADDSPLLPSGRLDRPQVLRWMLKRVEQQPPLRRHGVAYWTYIHGSAPGTTRDR
jgi:glutathione S-transferase